MPDATPTKTQLGRDALLVHCVALLFAAANLAVNSLLEQGTDVWTAAFFVSQIAAVVIGVWSLVLAMRALLTGELGARPMVVLGLLFTESTAALFLFSGVTGLPFPRFGRWYMDLCLPVVVPILILATLIALPVARWRVRRSAVVAPAAPVAPWPWKRALAWYGAVAALTAVVLLPYPLFMYCAYMQIHREWPNDRLGVRTWILEHTPVVVAEPSAWCLSLSDSRAFMDGYALTLATGRTSTRRLHAELNDPRSEVHFHALYGLQKADQAAALAWAERIGSGRTCVRGSHALDAAGRILGEHGSLEQVRRCLTADLQLPPYFFDGVINGIVEGRRRELLPELERSSEASPGERHSCLWAIAEIDTPEQLERRWGSYLRATDGPRRLEAINTIPYFPDHNVCVRVVLAALDRADGPAQDELLRCAPNWAPDWAGVNWRDADATLLARLVRRLAPLLDAEDLEMRRAVAAALGVMTTTPEAVRGPVRLLAQPWDGQTPRGGILPETESERVTIRQLREHVAQWLAKQAKEGK